MTHTPITRTLSTSRRRGRSSLVLATSVLVLAAALSSCSSGGSAGADQGKGESGGTNANTNANTNADADAGVDAAAGDSGTIDSCSLLPVDQLSAIIGSAVTVACPSIDVARGRSCTYSFAEAGSSILDEGTIDIAAWHGSEFFSPGTIGPARSGIGEEAQDDSDHGIVMFKVGDDVVQVHVISPDHKADSVQIASAAANRVAGASRSSRVQSD